MTSRPLYHSQAPGPLMARLCISFKLHDGTHVSYPRQEAAMPDATYNALCAECHTEMMLYLDTKQQQFEMQRRQAERAQRIRALWVQIKELEAEQRRGQRAAAGENAG